MTEEKRSAKKELVFYSFGVSDMLEGTYYPAEKPTLDCLRYLIDVRPYFPDPYHESDQLKGSGLDKNIVGFLNEKDQEKDILVNLRPMINLTIKTFCSQSQAKKCEIYFCCIGGWQRSVFVAERMYEFIKRAYHESLNVSIKHLCIDEWQKKK